MIRRLLFILLVTATVSGQVAVSVLPTEPLLATTRDGQSVHCELVLTNRTDRELVLDSIEVSVLDDRGALALRRSLTSNGMPGAIETVPVRKVPANGELVVFNPLHSFDAAMPVSKLRYTFRFESGESAEVDVRPRRYATKTTLMLPLAGRVLVHDGRDFYSHHRRLNVRHDFLRRIGVTGVSGRYAYDFVVVDAEGRMHRGSGAKTEEWLGWAAPVLAPAAGKVVAAEGAIPDNTFEDGVLRIDAAVTMDKPITIAGNYVVIDHGNGEWSMIAHLKQGTVKVRVGDTVNAGQELGAMGMSGDARIPHVHYQLQRGPDVFKDEGAPSTFTGLHRVLGSKVVAWPSGVIDSGDIVVSR